MAYGLRLWNAQGNVILDTSDDTVRLGGLSLLPAGSGTAVFQVAAGKRPLFLPVIGSDTNFTWGYSNGVFDFWLPISCYVFYGEC
ncbi:hypothetical protein [uncultured Brevundimonas sp.]|uniref:hypothetical protein n=1 Tax=uncultured Brevundimonas sp. TaxID=213418 RepID=UPI0025D546E6|nr:hypothetical protein [uncultured Brevundimonas sp.]